MLAACFRRMIFSGAMSALKRITACSMCRWPRWRGDGLRFLYWLSLHLKGPFGFAKPMSTLRQQSVRIVTGVRSAVQEVE